MAIKRETDGDSSLGLADPALLDKIDKLFACNVGEHIDLPQMVVVGDQSSGKSSVLEGLTKLKFPRNSGLCTRFATQILFRRVPGLKKRKISGSIIRATPHDAKEDWSVNDVEILDSSEFENMMVEVHRAMGLSTTTGNNDPTFSADVFRLEIHGPDENHLSVIDVPGIFKTTTPGLTSKSDIELVRSMVLGYMRNPRSIMLAVVPANVDIATQEIIEITRELDPDGTRTLRILTKPDLVDKGAEEKIIELVEGEQESQDLGWVVVKNLGQKDLQNPSKDRDVEEDVFRKTPPWNQLSDGNYGIAALARRLQSLLAANVRRVFPMVRSEISKRLKECRKTLEGLGDERGSPDQQKRYLFDVVAKFQLITENALNTNYATQDAFDNEPHLRLATMVANRNADFSADFALHGHVYNFKTHCHDDDDTSGDQKGSPPSPTGAVVDKADNEEDNSCNGTPSRKLDICDDIEDILHDNVGVHNALSQGILPWIEKLYAASRGFEIGTFNTSILASVLKKQSAKWPALAQGYICDIITMVHFFIRKALHVACGDQRQGEIILSFLMDDLVEKYQYALSRTDELLQIERDGTPMTQNHYLNSNLQKCRRDRTKSAVEKFSFSIQGQNGRQEKLIRISDLSRVHDMGNLEHTVQDIHDILKSYYKVTMKRFVDNMCKEPADHLLVTGPKSPVKIFSPSWISNLSFEQLEQIAGEEPSLRWKRQKMQQQVRDLEMGRKITL